MKRMPKTRGKGKKMILNYQSYFSPNKQGGGNQLYINKLYKYGVTKKIFGTQLLSASLAR